MDGGRTWSLPEVVVSLPASIYAMLLPSELVRAGDGALVQVVANTGMFQPVVALRTADGGGYWAWYPFPPELESSEELPDLSVEGAVLVARVNDPTPGMPYPPPTSM